MTDIDQSGKVLAERTAATGQMSMIEEMVIDSPEMLEIADGLLTAAARRRKEFEQFRDSVIDPIKASYDNARAQFRPIGEVYDVAISTLKRKMSDFKTRLRLEQKAAEEAAAVRDREAREAAEAARAKVEERFVEGEASIEELEKANAEVEIAQVTSTTVAMPAAPKTHSGSGTSFDVEIVDLPALLEFVAADLRRKAPEVPRFTNTVEIKIGQLKQFAKDTKGAVAIPGCKITESTKIIART